MLAGYEDSASAPADEALVGEGRGARRKGREARHSRRSEDSSDCADNPGAGARGNTTYLLKALLEAGVPRVFAGVFNDAALVEAATAVGEGGTFTAHLNTQEPDQFSEELQSEWPELAEELQGWDA